MSSTLGHSASDHASSGLDRAAFNVYDNADHHITGPLQNHAPTSSSSDDGTDDTDEGQQETSTSPSTFANVRRVSAKVRSKVKTKTHQILHTSHQQHAPALPAAPALAPAANPDGNDDRLFHPVPEDKKPQVKDVLHNPVDTVSSLLQGASHAKMADVMDNQVIAHGANVNLVRVYDQVADPRNKEEQQSALAELEDLKKARQDQYVRWTMDRHVLKVRRIPPHNLQRPQKKDFRTGDQGGQGHVNWAKYGEHVRTLQYGLCIRALAIVRSLRKGSNAEPTSSSHASMPGTMVTSTSMTRQLYLRHMRTLSIPVSKGFSWHQRLIKWCS